MPLPQLTTSGSRWGRHSPHPVIARGTLGAFSLPTCKQQHANNSLASADTAGAAPASLPFAMLQGLFSPHLPATSGSFPPEIPPGAISWERLIAPPAVTSHLFFLWLWQKANISRCFLPRAGTMGLGSWALGCPLSQWAWLPWRSKHPSFSFLYLVTQSLQGIQKDFIKLSMKEQADGYHKPLETHGKVL